MYLKNLDLIVLILRKIYRVLNELRILKKETITNHNSKFNMDKD